MALTGERSALQFLVRLNDRVTGPMGRVSRTVLGQAHSMAGGVNRATDLMRSGFLAGTAGAIGLTAALRPAIEHQRAMGEVRSLGVAGDALKALDVEARRFTRRFGGNATEVVRSAYDIQSAIAGLQGNELARFTAAATLTAKATKATAGEVTSFFGTMFGIFERQAERMGRARWVDMLAGQTAQTVQMFKTTGSQISGAFTTLGASATTMGVAMAEQFAVLGSLQATMPGPEAGTKYRAFLFGLGKAQDFFNLRFTDTQGRLLALPKILDMIRPRLAGLSAVEQADVLMKAFGRKEAVALVQLLIGQTDKLQRSIGALGRTRGLGPAVEMAEAMVDPWMRLGAGARNLAITIGNVLLPVVNPLVDRMTHGTQVLQDWTVRFPNLTRLVVIGAAGVFAFALAVGVAKVGLGLLLLALQPMKALLFGARAAMLLFNRALWTSPVTWLLAGLAILAANIIAVGGAFAYAIYDWEGFLSLAKRFSAWFDSLPGWAQVLGLVFAPLLAIPAKIGANWDALKSKLGSVLGWLKTFAANVTNTFDVLAGPDTMIGRLLRLAGIKSSPDRGAGPQADDGESRALTRLPAAEPLGPEARQALTNIASSDSSRRVRIDRLTITPKEEVSADFLSRTLAAEALL